MNLKNKIFAAGVCFCGLMAAIAVFCIMPVVSKIRQTAIKIGEQNDKISSLDRSVEEIKEYRIYYRQHQDDFAKLDGIFINAEMPLQFINFLDAAAQDCQVAIKMEPAQKILVKGDEWPSINFQISLEGTFPRVIQFIEKIEASPFLAEVKSAGVSAKTAVQPEGSEDISLFAPIVSANILLKAYSRN